MIINFQMSFRPPATNGSTYLVRGMSLKTLFNKISKAEFNRNGFRPPSGNEFKNDQNDVLLSLNGNLLSFRPPSGNEFKN